MDDAALMNVITIFLSLSAVILIFYGVLPTKIFKNLLKIIIGILIALIIVFILLGSTCLLLVGGYVYIAFITISIILLVAILTIKLLIHFLKKDDKK